MVDEAGTSIGRLAGGKAGRHGTQGFPDTYGSPPIQPSGNPLSPATTTEPASLSIAPSDHCPGDSHRRLPHSGMAKPEPASQGSSLTVAQNKSQTRKNHHKGTGSLENHPGPPLTNSRPAETTLESGELVSLNAHSFQDSHKEMGERQFMMIRITSPA